MPQKKPFNDFYLHRKKQLELGTILRSKKRETVDLQLRVIECDKVRENNRVRSQLMLAKCYQYLDMSSDKASIVTKPSLRKLFGEKNEELDYFDKFED